MLIEQAKRISLMAIFFQANVYIYTNVCHAQPRADHNLEQESSISSVHYRRTARVEFKDWVEDRTITFSAGEKAAIKKRVARYSSKTKEQTGKFSEPLPPLPRCERSQTKVKKNFFRLENNQKIDLLIFDPAEG